MLNVSFTTVFAIKFNNLQNLSSDVGKTFVLLLWRCPKRNNLNGNFCTDDNLQYLVELCQACSIHPANYREHAMWTHADTSANRHDVISSLWFRPNDRRSNIAVDT